MRSVNVLEAKTHFSALLREVGCGREVVITNRGKPVARLAPISGSPSARVYGALRDVLGRRAPSAAEVAAALAPMADSEAEAAGWQ